MAFFEVCYFKQFNQSVISSFNPFILISHRATSIQTRPHIHLSPVIAKRTRQRDPQRSKQHIAAQLANQAFLQRTTCVHCPTVQIKGNCHRRVSHTSSHAKCYKVNGSVKECDAFDSRDRSSMAKLHSCINASPPCVCVRVCVDQTNALTICSCKR